MVTFLSPADISESPKERQYGSWLRRRRFCEHDSHEFWRVCEPMSASGGFDRGVGRCRMILPAQIPFPRPWQGACCEEEGCVECLELVLCIEHLLSSVTLMKLGGWHTLSWSARS